MSLTIEQLITQDYGTGPDPGYFHNDVQVSASRYGTKFEITIADRTALADNTYFTIFVDGEAHEVESEDGSSTNAEFDYDLATNDLVAADLARCLNAMTNFGDTGSGSKITVASAAANVVTFYSLTGAGKTLWNETIKYGLQEGTSPMSSTGVTFAVTPPKYADISNLTGGDHLAIAFPDSVSEGYDPSGPTGGFDVTKFTAASKIMHWLCERLRQAQLSDDNEASDLLSHKMVYNRTTGKLKTKYTLVFEVGVNHLSDQSTEKMDAPSDWTSPPGTGYTDQTSWVIKTEQ